MIDENIKNAWDKINPSEAKKQRIMNKIYEAENKSNRRVGIRTVLIASVIAALAMTTVFAAPVWRYLETRIIQGSVYTYSGHFIVREYDGERVFDISGIPELGAAPTVVEVDGDRLTLYDPRNFFSNSDLDEILGRYLMIENIMLPTYIPESLSFMRLKIHVCPVRNPDEFLAGRSATIYYVDNNFSRVSFGIHHREAWEVLGGWDLFFPQHWWDGTHDDNAIDAKEVEINGHRGYMVYWGGFSEYAGEYEWFSTLLVYVDDMVYFLYGRIEPVELVRMIESLR